MRLPGVLAFALASCVARPSPWRGATDPEWPGLRQELDAARAARPVQPWAAGVRATVHEPRSARVLEARGALAVAPGKGLRMILVAGPGATALDAWVTADRWRVAVPAADVLRRGGAEAPPDLPVAFLRWWFLGPLRGTLFAATREGGRPAWLLRDGDAVLELRLEACARGTMLRVARRASGRTERVDECRAGAVPQVGDSVRYVDEAGGLEVDLELESVAAAPPAPEAFDDPDGRSGP
jgi:hypothetical protein